MKLVVNESSNAGASPISARCPHCRKEAVLEALGQDLHFPPSEFICGQRRCPNPECRGHIFVIYERGSLRVACPPIRLDFDPSDIPDTVSRSFEEAVTCHATDCFIASGIMVRRTLEELCADRGAKGKTLSDRLQDLKSKVVLPKELLDAMDEIRLLGNDAAHLEAREYDDIGQEEIEVAIEFTKEILKSVYQYASLLHRMRALKKPQP